MEPVAVCSISEVVVCARGVVHLRFGCQWRRRGALIGVCALAAIIAATTSSLVFTPGPRFGHDVAKCQRDAVQCLMEVRSAPPAPHGGNKGDVGKIASEEAFSAVHGSGDDVVVMLTFPWCRTCKHFKPTFKRFAKIYGATLFTEICGNENDFTKHYAREVLNVRFSPTFALYSDGKMVKTWTGGCHEEFIKNVEQALPSATGRIHQALVDAGYA